LIQCWPVEVVFGALPSGLGNEEGGWIGALTIDRAL
jgi:hypothetical protein